MDHTPAVVAVEEELDADRCAVLGELAGTMPVLSVATGQLTRLRPYAFRLRVDARTVGGEDVQRDGSAA